MSHRLSPPSASSLREYGVLLDALRGVTWPARRAVAAGSAGTHRSRLRGLSAEFTEYRPYRQGDDSRRLDWKLLARTDRAYLRITRDRATLGTIVVVDASPSMAFPAESRAKWRQACRLAVGLAAVAHGSGDPVGVVIAGAHRPLRLESRTRRGVIGDIVRVLEAAEPDPGHAPADETALAGALAALRGAPRIAIVSDFLSGEAPLLREARTLAASGTELCVVHVVAARELAPEPRTVLATDPDAPDRRRPFTAEAIPRYRAAFDAWRAALAREWRAAGASYAEVRDDEAAARAVRRVVAPAAAGLHL